MKDHSPVLALVICLISSLAGGCMAHMHSFDGAATQGDESLLGRVAFDKVDRITIYYSPEESLGIEPMDGDKLETACWATLSLRNFQYSKLKDRLLLTLKETSIVSAANASSDVRWGCVLYDRHGNRLMAIYLGADGCGLLNQAKIKTDGRFLKYLRQEFRCLAEVWSQKQRDQHVHVLQK